MSCSKHSPRRLAASRAALTATLFAVGATLSACGGDDKGHEAGKPHTSQGAPSPAAAPPASPASPATAPAGQFNDADVKFAQMMIAHHRQAIQMSDLAPARASNPQLKKLASQIKAAQGPEIATLTQWLGTWNKPLEPAGGHGAGHGGGHAMPGMMSQADMGKLKAATGAKFDRMFATMMIAHHEGAIEMAKTEQAQGADPKAKDLAATIIKIQQAEIDTMRTFTR